MNERNGALMTKYYSASPESQKDSTFMAGIMDESKKIEEDREALLKQFLAGHTKSHVALDVVKTALAGSTPEYAEVYPFRQAEPRRAEQRSRETIQRSSQQNKSSIHRRYRS